MVEKKKGKHIVFIFVVTILIAILSLIVFSLFTKDYCLYIGRGYLQRAEATSTLDDVEKNLKVAIPILKVSALLNKFSVFNHSNLSETYCLLGEASLCLRDNKSAKKYFEEAKRTFREEESYTTLQGLELKLSQSMVLVNAIIGNDRALVNGNMVSRGDVVKGIEVRKITSSYVLFKNNDIVFSDSPDKYNLRARELRKKAREHFQMAEEIDNLGFAHLKYNEIKTFIRQTLKQYTMDKEQTDEMQSLINKCDEKIALIDKKISIAKRQNKFIVGMNEQDVKEILGNPLNRNELFEMKADEKWVYDDKILYFKKAFGGEDNNILVDYKEKSPERGL